MVLILVNGKKEIQGKRNRKRKRHRDRDRDRTEKDRETERDKERQRQRGKKPVGNSQDCTVFKLFFNCLLDFGILIKH